MVLFISDYKMDWRQSAIDRIKLKKFLLSSEKDCQSPESSSKDNSAPTISQPTNETGNDVKSFYEEVCHEKSDSNDCTIENEVVVINDGLNSSNESFLKLRDIHRAFNFAQNNNYEGLKDLIDNGFNVNSKDEYGWSLLMCSACAGSTECVKLLLRHNVRVGHRDSKGNTAIYLASMKGYNNIVELLIKHNKLKEKSNKQCSDIEVISSNNDKKVKEFFCKVCNELVKNTPKLNHETSIVHQFNLGPVSNKTIYGIPPSNKGFQLMLNQGWDENKGLGPEGSGLKYPVKTTLKSDRKGFGVKTNSVARVTHFDPGDAKAIQNIRIERNKTIDKRQKKIAMQKDKLFEINLRKEFNL